MKLIAGKKISKLKIPRHKTQKKIKLLLNKMRNVKLKIN